MGIQAIAAVAMIVLLGACADPKAGPSQGDDLSTSETQFYSFQRALPLPVSTSPGDTLYRNPMLGIDVVEVLADDRPIAPKPSLVLFVGVDSSPVKVRSRTYIYDISLDHMLFWKSDLSLVEYSIPEDTEVLVIRYRLVRHDSAPGERVYTVKASRSS